MSYSLLVEIVKLNNISKDDETLKTVMRNQFALTGFRKIKDLGSKGQYKFSLYRNKDKCLMGVIRANTSTDVIGAVYLEPLIDSNFHAYVTDATQIKEKHRGKDLGYLLYKKLVESGLILVSSDCQSPGGQHIWKQLHADKSINVQKYDIGYIHKFSRPVKSTASAYKAKSIDQLQDTRLVAFKKS